MWLLKDWLLHLLRYLHHHWSTSLECLWIDHHSAWTLLTIHGSNWYHVLGKTKHGLSHLNWFWRLLTDCRSYFCLQKISLILSELSVHFTLDSWRWWTHRQVLWRLLGQVLWRLLGLGLLFLRDLHILISNCIIHLLHSLAFFHNCSLVNLCKLRLKGRLLWDRLHLGSIVRLLLRCSSLHKLLKASEILFKDVFDTFELVSTRGLHCHHLNVSNISLCSFLRM